MKQKNNPPIYIDQYDYALPDERIANYPLVPRDSSKLLVYQNGNISTSHFASISDFLPEGTLLVYNNTRVIHARLVFYNQSGARIEVFCLNPLTPADYAQSLSATSECVWKCMVGNLKKWKGGTLQKTVEIGDTSSTFSAELLQTEGNTHSVRFTWNNTNIHFGDILEKAGELPIPPYLHRKAEESDLTTYQTIYANIAGSVAAPTAGLHFTPEVFKTLEKKNIVTEELTLHIGAGTFQPIKTPDIAAHQMHTEVISVHRDTIAQVQQKLGNIIAVGTTSVRTLESLYHLGIPLNPLPLSGINCGDFKIFHVNQWEPYPQRSEISTYDALQNILDYLDANNLTTLHAETQLMIKPGYQFRLVNGMITNFHQPRSTLLLLVSAFVDGNWKQMYDYALENDFRFLSYGDSSLLLR